MKSSKHLSWIGLAAILVGGAVYVEHGQDAVPTPTVPLAPPRAATNAPATNSPATHAAPGATTNAPAGGSNAAPVEAKKLPTDLIEVSFQNMQIDQLLNWLSENTGKSVVKHPQVHCQITIVSSKKVTRREAVTMVYRALGMEGFTAIESADSILIVPADEEAKMNLSPEMAGSTNAVPGGRERWVKVFTLQHLPAADVTEKVKTVLSKDAVVVTDDRANLLIVTDYNDNLVAADGLIKALDVDKHDDVILRSISLKNVDAQDLAKQMEPLYQKLTGKQSKELIEVSASQVGNTLMVLSSADNFKEIEKFARSLDTADAQEKVMRTFELKNADAEDVAKQLQDLGKDQQDNNGPYRYFYFGGGNPNDNGGKKTSIVADRRRNAIVVQAPASEMDIISNTISELDAPISDNSLAPKIVPLENVSAGDIEDVLNELFLKKTTQRSYFDYFDEPQQTPDRDVGRLYGKVRITSEAADNALIVTANSQENLDAVIAVVKELDKPSSAGDTTYHIRLNFADAQKVANRINILFAKNGSQALRPVNQPNPNGQNQQPQPQPQNAQGTPPADDFSLEQVVKEDPYYSWLGGAPDANGRNNGGGSDRATERPVSDLVGRVRVVPDEAGSSVLVTANVHLFAQVSKMIADMDVPPAQVLLDARLVQVSADYLSQIGVRYSPDGSQVFSGADLQNSLMPSIGGSYQKGVGGKTTVNNPANSSTATDPFSVLQSLSSLRSGMLTGNINMDFLIQFLQEKADATVLSEPQLTIADNDLGKLFVGQAVPIETGNVSPSIGGSSTTFTYRNVGVIVEVEPHINDNGDVQLRVRAESSTLDPTEFNGQAVIDSAQFRTELTARAGETLVLGGIIQKEMNNTVYKTPILGDIPGLKYIFSKHDKSIKRSELLVFLRPKVVRTPEQARQLLLETRKTMPLIQGWEKQDAADDAKHKSH